MNKLTGWKTKTGVIVGVIGAALLAGAQAIPPNAFELSGWLNFAGIILSSVGTGLAGIGIAHKGEKNAEKVAQAVKNGGQK